MTQPTGMTSLELDYELKDGTVDRCRILNRSLIAWDETRGRRKWPTSEEAPTLWQTFVLWHALTRSGKYVGEFSTFKDEDCLQVEMYLPDEDDDAALDPATGQALVPPTQTTGPALQSSSPPPVEPSPPAESPGGMRTTTDS